MMSAKTTRLLYVLALLVFLLGAGDFFMYITQRYKSFEEGLWDQFAQTGLGIWWAVALGIAAFTYLRSKKG